MLYGSQAICRFLDRCNKDRCYKECKNGYSLERLKQGYFKFDDEVICQLKANKRSGKGDTNGKKKKQKRSNASDDDIPEGIFFDEKQDGAPTGDSISLFAV